MKWNEVEKNDEKQKEMEKSKRKQKLCRYVFCLLTFILIAQFESYPGMFTLYGVQLLELYLFVH